MHYILQCRCTPCENRTSFLLTCLWCLAVGSQANLRLSVADHKDRWSGRYTIVHNIGQGPKMEDVLFNWKITGHYRYYGPS